MRRYDPDDSVSLRHEVRDLDGALTDATVTLTITKPSGESYSASVTNAAVGTYDATVPGDEVDELGTYRWAWSVTGPIQDESLGQFYVATDGDELPPLASVERLGRKLGYVPEGSEYDRAAHLLNEASELIRDVAGKTWANTDTGALEAVPRRVMLICVAAAFRSFGNPEGLTQRTIGDSSKAYDRAGREGGEDVYLTKAEESDIHKAAGNEGGSMVVVTLASPYGGYLLDTWAEATIQ